MNLCHIEMRSKNSLPVSKICDDEKIILCESTSVALNPGDKLTYEQDSMTEVVDTEARVFETSCTESKNPCRDDEKKLDS